MPPDSLQWWRDQAVYARTLVRENPESADASCLLAMALGRCLIMGERLNWTVSLKRALLAAESFVSLINHLTDKLRDVPWLIQLLPEEMAETTAALLSHRVDIFGVQTILDDVFDRASKKQMHAIDPQVDTIVRALVALDTQLWEVFPLLQQHGHITELIVQCRVALLSDYHDQWWLDPDSTGPR